MHKVMASRTFSGLKRHKTVLDSSNSFFFWLFRYLYYLKKVLDYIKYVLGLYLGGS